MRAQIRAIQERLNVVRDHGKVQLAKECCKVSAGEAKINSIKVKLGGSGTKLFKHIDDTTTVRALSVRVRSVFELEAEVTFELCSLDIPLALDETLKNQGCTSGTVLTAKLEPPEFMVVTVTRRGQDALSIQAKASDTIDDVKAKIQTAGGPPPDQQRLKAGRINLEDGSHTFQEYGGKTLQLVKPVEPSKTAKSAEPVSGQLAIGTDVD